MKYHFNVTLAHAFFFRTDYEHDTDRVERTQKELVARFPKSEGFEVMLVTTTSGATYQVVN